MNALPNGAHPGDGGLLRLLDGQADASERENVEQHVAACEECSLVFDELRHAAHTVRNELALDIVRLPASVPVRLRPRHGLPVWKVAAGIVILLAATSALQPVRALMVSGWQSAVDLLAGAETASVPELGTPGDLQPVGAVVSFSPRSARLVIDVASWQEAGELTILVGTHRNVSAQVLSAESSEHMTIAPSGGVSIGNASTSVSNYRVTVPSTLEQVTVRIAGVEIAQFAPTMSDAPRVVRLTSR